MIDIKRLRDQPAGVEAALARRGGGFPIEEVLSLDAQRRATQTSLDAVRREQKDASGAVAKASKDERPAMLDKAKALSEQVKTLEGEERALADKVRELMLRIPNPPHETVPDGGEDDAVQVSSWGTPPSFGFEPRDHLDIGEALDIIDVTRGARTSGARFAYLKGRGALLELALVRFAIDRLGARGFAPVIPPVLVRREAMEGTGFLPTDEAQIYRLADDDLYLVGTSEVPLAALHMDEMLNADQLPLRYCGFSSCFRREAGTYGKDTRGIFRVHQFDKVEMFSFADPSSSWDEHEFLRETQESLLQDLEIPYRVMNIAAGDLGQPAAKKYDVEGWLPGQNAYRELTSASNCTDYQARRLNCRARFDGAAAPVHTLNGTAVAVGRTIIALLENHQQADGTVRIPDALAPYTGFSALGG